MSIVKLSMILMDILPKVIRRLRNNNTVVEPIITMIIRMILIHRIKNYGV